MTSNLRPLHTIAGEALADTTLKGNARRYARPYLRALTTLSTSADRYGADDGRTIIAYALANLQTWRGDSARRVKAELRAHAASA